MHSTKKSTDRPSVEAFANGGKVWLAQCLDCEMLMRFDSPYEVDEFIAALEESKRQAWPERATISGHRESATQKVNALLQRIQNYAGNPPEWERYAEQPAMMLPIAWPVE